MIFIYRKIPAILRGLIWLIVTSGCMAWAGDNIDVSLGQSRSWHPYAMGANTKFLEDHPFDSGTENIKNMDRLGLRSFRYPGGTAGNDWDWVLGTKGKSAWRFPPKDLAILNKKMEVINNQEKIRSRIS